VTEYNLVVDPDLAGERVDKFLASIERLGLSRSQIQQLIGDSLVKVNGDVVKPSYTVQPGDEIWVGKPEPREATLVAQDMPLDIVYEDSDLLVVNKQPGLVVHPAPGHPRGTLVNALLSYCDDLQGVGDELRPGIVHRLDKDTTGVLVVAKNDESHRALSRALAARRVHRVYLALVHGSPAVNTGLVDAPIGRHPRDRKRMAVNTSRGREARTYFEVRERLGDYALIECRLETGRTHQIRVHMAYIGHPVVGDPVYGPSPPHFSLTRQLLHAHRLEFRHPKTGEKVAAEAPLPGDMARILELLREKMRGLTPP